MTQPADGNSPPGECPPWWQPALLAGLAGGMAWGIRGQYGHETGAMIAGLLVSLVLVLLFRPDAAALPAMRAVAFGTIAMGFGGTMTYGQTIGLTQNASLIGHWDALGWGMLGLAIKGAIWIGFAGLFLGMALGGVPYRARHILALMLGLLALYALGVWVLNRPFEPAERLLPRIYFSADWRWYPDATPEELKPRREHWGGLLFALLGAWVWAGWIRRDQLARRLTLWGALGGLGFPIGQSLQAFHAWNPEFFESGFWAQLDPHMNWWNWMETTFGLVMGACLGLGLWVNRRHIGPLRQTDPPEIKPALEAFLALIHLPLLLLVEFAAVPAVDAVYDVGLCLGLIPLVGVAGGRWWPLAVVFPLTALPILGKTIRALVFEAQAIAPVWGWLVYGALPLALMIALAVRADRKVTQGWPAAVLLRPALLWCTWFYFAINFAFFRFPWPWSAWTPRTPNALAFFLCAVGLTLACVCQSRRALSLQSQNPATPPPRDR
ncbi:MAG: hypothetical protein N3I86_01250 [Verrucomicrobiae bacterium]|nr:hypothetical protein [Verrucomicrobiae bacterium]